VKAQLLIAAAGMGQRLGLGTPKALIDIEGKPLLIRTLDRLRPLNLVDTAVILAPPEHLQAFEGAIRDAFPKTRIRIVPGGAERQISVQNGLKALEPDTEIVVIHDAARPFVPVESVRASIEAATECGASTVAIPSSDTILVADKDAILLDTPDRRGLWACQTPQTFQVGTIRHAHEWARKEGYLGTDDATLVCGAGGKVKLVMGSPRNFKVTTPWDLELARWVVKEGLI